MKTQKYQYFGPPFTVQLETRSLFLRHGSLMDLDDTEAKTIRFLDKNGLRLVPVPLPKRITPPPEKVLPLPVSDEFEPEPEENLLTTEGEDGGVLIEEEKIKEETSKKKKYKSKKKKKGQDAPNTDEEG